MTRASTEYERGLAALGSASSALKAANLEHWFFGGWAVDLWMGRLTRPHDDIDVLVWRRDEARVDDS
jgi:Aminoglycoside-2''-adenylyltransferase